MRFHVAELLCNTENEPLQLELGIILLDQRARCGDISGNGLFGEDVFSGGEAAADYGGLDGDGEDNYDGVDVGAGEEGREVGGGGPVVGVEGDVGIGF